MISEYRRTLRLKAEHVDCFRALRLSVLMRLFQECCIAHTEDLGMGREKTLDRGFLWIVNAEMIRVRRMPEYDEEITLVCRPGQTLHYFFPRQMAVLDRDGMEIIRIGAVWSLIDEKTRRSLRRAFFCLQAFRPALFWMKKTPRREAAGILCISGTEA